MPLSEIGNLKYPYHIVPDVERYRKLDPDTPEAMALSRRIAVNIGDYAALRLVLGIDPPEFAKFYPDMETASPSTMDTIDSFLDKFGSNLPDDPLPMDAAPQYSIEPEESTIQENFPDSLNEDPEDAKPANLGQLIKNKRYSDALQFIESQNLNNTQKSIYFAHQIRFIKKLMALEKFKNKKMGH